MSICTLVGREAGVDVEYRLFGVVFNGWLGKGDIENAVMI